jgi:hypothetical protein
MWFRVCLAGAPLPAESRAAHAALRPLRRVPRRADIDVSAFGFRWFANPETGNASAAG